MSRRLLPLLALVLAGCATVSAKDRQKAASHFEIASTALAGGDPRTALAEVEQAAKLDPKDPEIHHLHGLLLHVYFGELDAAASAYLRAIALKPGYSEAKVNLSAVYLATSRCELAVPMLEEARRDLLYREPYLAENNLGWCKYQLGDSEAALRHLRAAVSINPGFCLGYSNLGEIMENQGRMDEALRFVERYAKTCPDVADAEWRRGLLLLERGRTAEARTAFVACIEKAKNEDLAGECVRHAELIPGS